MHMTTNNIYREVAYSTIQTDRTIKQVSGTM